MKGKTRKDRGREGRRKRDREGDRGRPSLKVSLDVSLMMKKVKGVEDLP